ncbi:MAG: ATP-binding protein [Candidatus Saccharimonadales bacterium]
MTNKLRSVTGFLIKEKEIPIAVIVALALSGLTIFLYLKNTKTETPNVKNSIAIESSVVPESSATIAQKGESLQWQKSVGVSGSVVNVDGTITEKINKDQQTFDGGLELPKGWSATYSCDDGVSFVVTTTTSPCLSDADVDYIKIQTGTSQTLKPFSQSGMILPPKEVELDNGAFHGMGPIMYKDKFYQIMQSVIVQDAGSQDDFTINCFDLKTYSQCEGYPTYMSTSAGPLGTGPKDINTPMAGQFYVDDGTYGNDGRLYVAGQSGANYGVVCVDLVLQQNCGFTILGSTGTTYGGVDNPVKLSGFVMSDGKLYGDVADLDQTKQTVVCYDLNSDGNGADAPCSGYSSSTTLSIDTYYTPEHYDVYYNGGTHIAKGGKLYSLLPYSYKNIYATTLFPPPSSQRSYGYILSCFDLNTKVKCSGWNDPAPFWPGGGIFTSWVRIPGMFAWKNSDNSLHAVCLTYIFDSGIIDPHMQCFDQATGANIPLDGSSSSQPSQMVPTSWQYIPWEFGRYTTDITDSEGSKTYFPVAKRISLDPNNSSKDKGGTMCWNWTTGSKCSGQAWQNQPKYWYGVNNNQSNDLGYVYDGSCMWGVGDNAVGFGSGLISNPRLWSFDAKTGESPCRIEDMEFTTSINADDFYCDGQSHVFSWGKVKLSNASMYDFDSLEVTVKNSAGTVLKQENIKANGYLDLSSISYSGNENLKLEIKAVNLNTTPWANNNKPFVSVEADADNAQICYKTKATNYCDISNIAIASDAEIATGSDILSKDETTSIALNQPSNEQCFKDAKITITADKQRISEGENVSYQINIDNKANSNIYNRGNIIGAQVRASLPAGFSYVSSSNGGYQSGSYVYWDNVSINAGSNTTYSLVVKAPQNLSSIQKSTANKVFAATTDVPAVLTATIIYDDDVDQADNTTSNQVTLVKEIPDNDGGQVGNNGGEEPPVDQEAPIDNNETTQDDNQATGLPQSSNNTNNNKPSLIPGFIRRLVPNSLMNQTESIFRFANSVVQPIPNTVAIAIPYAIIAFLIAFVAVYIYQAIIAKREKDRLDKVRKDLKRTEELSRNYVSLTTHYLHTPIATMESTIELLAKENKLPKSTVDSAERRLGRLKYHIQFLLDGISGIAESIKDQAGQIESKIKRRSLIGKTILIPIFSVLIGVVFINSLFIWSGKYEASRAVILTQSLNYLLATGAFVIAFVVYRNQAYAQKVAEHELKLEQDLSLSQLNFVKNSSATLDKDIEEMSRISKELANSPRAKLFDSGLVSLKDLASKFDYLSILQSESKSPIIADATIKNLALNVVDELQAFANQNNIKIECVVDSGLTAKIDKEGLNQLLYSTLHNAIKFSKEGDVVKLSINNSDTRHVVITVSDKGSGIPKEKIDTLMMPFGRLTSTEQFDFSGIGLDLYMDRLIIDKVGGEISIVSKLGEGTNIKMTIPS